MSDDLSFSSGDIAAAASAPSAPAASDASPASAPSASSPSAPAPTVPASQESSSVSPSSSVPSSGEPPKERWPEILDHARKKASEEARAAVDQEVGWARSIKREELEEWSRTAQKMSRDPVAFLREFAQEIRNHPVYGPQLRSEAARTLATRQPAKPPEPDVQITDAAGNVVGRTYSDKGWEARLAYEKAQWVGQMQQEIAPLKEDHARSKAEKQAAEIRHQAESTADAILKDASQWHGYAEHKTAIAGAMQQHPEWSLERAYLDVLHRDILPNLTKTERAKVLADISTKPAASVVSPSSGTAGVPKPDADKSWAELFKEKYEQFSGR